MSREDSAIERFLGLGVAGEPGSAGESASNPFDGVEREPDAKHGVWAVERPTGPGGTDVPLESNWAAVGATVCAIGLQASLPVLGVGAVLFGLGMTS